MYECECAEGVWVCECVCRGVCGGEYGHVSMWGGVWACECVCVGECGHMDMSLWVGGVWVWELGGVGECEHVSVCM